MRKPILGEIASITRDIDIFWGWIRRMENPDPILRSEARGRGLRLYDEVDRDPHASAVIQQRIMAVVGKEWEIIPGEAIARPGRPANTTQEQRIADFVSAVLTNTNFDQARAEIMKAILYGYYVLEIIWGMVDGNVVVKQLIGKHPRRFVFTPERELRLLTRNGDINGEAVPERKFIVLTFGDSDNPYGRGLGQRLWWPVWFKKHGIKFWLTFLEKFGMPTVIGKYPPGISDEEKAALMDAIQAVQTDAGITMPETMGVDLIEAARSGTATYEQLCEYMDRQISKTVLGQTLSTELNSGGSYAAAQTHLAVKQEIVEADADLLDETLNATLVRWIVDYNFPDVTTYPVIRTAAAPKPDLAGQVQIVKALYEIGLPISHDYLYSTYGIPAPVGDEPVTARYTPPPTNAPIGGIFAEKTNDDVITKLTENLAAKAGKVVDADLIEPIKKLVNKSTSLQMLEMTMLSVWDDMSIDKLARVIAEGMIGAQMVGRADVQQETARGRRFADDMSAMDAVFNLPFSEQEKFFKRKLNIPTKKWTDLWKYQHGRGFMVAGAEKAELLDDLREAVRKAIEDGVTLEDFRKDFDAIVERHGWAYRGERDWRSEVIYSTNIRSSYAVGRWEQLNDPDILDYYPYLEYRHGGSYEPRPEHLAWNGLVLRRDDPWWDTHYPPNGWGCSCRVFAATGRQFEKAQKAGLGSAPPVRIDKESGEPVGIDKGWGYHVGKSKDVKGTILDPVLKRLPDDIATKLRADLARQDVGT